MKTVDKAMTVLDQFSVERTEIGLSDLARTAGLDKAATRRLLVALSKHGFIEQITESKKYRLGQGFLRLARIREATVPLTKAAQEVNDWLAAKVSETTHISVAQSESLATIAHQMPRRGNIINVDPAEPLPFHATASGIAYLAFASNATRARILALPRTRFAAQTLLGEDQLRAKIETTKQDGFALSRHSFEDGVGSIAMTFSMNQPDPAGAISIALPEARLTPSRITELLPILKEAVSRIETTLNGNS